MVTDPRVTGLERNFNSRMTTAADKQKAAKVPVWQGVFAYFSSALQAVGAISRMGAAKHNNGVMPTKWRDYPVDVYADALARHITEENKGDLYDSESNMLHAGHEAWNALARLEKLLEVHPLVRPEPETEKPNLIAIEELRRLRAASSY